MFSDDYSLNNSTGTSSTVGNEIDEAGKGRLRELGHGRPELLIIGDFVDDLGLL